MTHFSRSRSHEQQLLHSGHGCSTHKHTHHPSVLQVAGPLRVWPGGLAMTRSLGDHEAGRIVIGGCRRCSPFPLAWHVHTLACSRHVWWDPVQHTALAHQACRWHFPHISRTPVPALSHTHTQVSHHTSPQATPRCARSRCPGRAAASSSRRTASGTRCRPRPSSPRYISACYKHEHQKGESWGPALLASREWTGMSAAG